MPALTRRRDDDRHQQSWRVFYGDIEIGWIGQRAGVPVDVEQWGWFCGFFPASHRGVSADGIATTFEQARAEFEAAWSDILPRCSDQDFEEHRYQRASLKWKYRMWDTGCRMPTQTVSGMTKCFFLSRLLEAGVDVRFADLPQIDGARGRLLMQQMVAVAELEAGMISARTKAALAAAKRRGKKLGGKRRKIVGQDDRGKPLCSIFRDV